MIDQLYVQDTTRIGTLNLRTLAKPEKIDMLLPEVNRYKWDITGLSETHLSGNSEEHRRRDPPTLWQEKGNTQARCWLFADENSKKISSGSSVCLGKIDDYPTQKQVHQPLSRAGVRP
jgi:hypothetical protein